MVNEHSHPTAWAIIGTLLLISFALVWTSLSNNIEIDDLKNQLENKADRICWEEEMIGTFVFDIPNINDEDIEEILDLYFISMDEVICKGTECEYHYTETVCEIK